MTVKKLALLGLASVATLGMSISMAGGPAACAPEAQVSGVYVGVNVGAMYDNTLDFDRGNLNANSPWNFGPVTVTGATGYSKSSVPWAWTIDALVGYQFNNNWALQFGYIWNQRQNMTIEGATGFSVITAFTGTATIRLQTYNLYLGLKGMLPLWNDFGAYMMVGPAWTRMRLQYGFSTASGRNGASTQSYWSPMGALGVSWNAGNNFSVNLQYMYIMGDLATNDSRSLDGDHRGAQRITVGANYLFAM